jgi:hypothetical protein
MHMSKALWPKYLKCDQCGQCSLNQKNLDLLGTGFENPCVPFYIPHEQGIVAQVIKLRSVGPVLY